MRIIIDIPDDEETEVNEAFAVLYNYQEFIGGIQAIPNPRTKKQFTFFQIEEFMKGVYRGYKVDKGLEVAKKTILIDAEASSNNFTVGEQT